MLRFQIIFIAVNALLVNPSCGEMQRIRDIFEFHLVSLKIDSPVIPNSHVASCCLKGSWLPPDSCSVRCRVFLRVCLTTKNGSQLNQLPHLPCRNATIQTISTSVILQNNILFNSSLDYRLNIHQSSQGPFILQIAVYHRSLTGDEILLSDLLPIEVQPSHRSIWTTQQLGPDVVTLSYRFICPPNYYGAACERYCAARNSVLGHYRCDPKDGRSVCLDGWKGNQCMEAICENGCLHGSCKSPGVCKCHEGWQGQDCDQCIPIPGCQHGGCKANWTLGYPEPFTCSCKPGWSGMFCSIDTQFCSNHPGTCKNGGICHNTPSESGASPGYACQCPLGFQGYHCENKNNDCRVHGCHGKGICKDVGECECFENYYGSNCQYNQTNCSENPCHGEQSVCNPDPSRGKWNNTKVKFQCVCQTGLTGINCEEELRLCDYRPCKHGGKCVDLARGYQCVCLPGYKGRHCELLDSACQHLPCANGGECVDRANRVECRCPLGWTGLTCRQNVNECASMQLGAPVCKNGAACRDRVGTYECLCTAGWRGRDCSLSTPAFTSAVNATLSNAKEKPDYPCDGSGLLPTKCNVFASNSIREESSVIRSAAIISTVLLILCLGIILLVLLLRQRLRRKFGVGFQFGQSSRGWSKDRVDNLQREQQQQQQQDQQIAMTPAYKVHSNKCSPGVYWTNPNEMFVCGFDANSSQPRLLQLKEGQCTTSSSSSSPPYAPSSLSSDDKQRTESFTKVIATSPMQIYPGRMHPQFYSLRPTDVQHAVVYTCQTPPPPYDDLVRHPTPHEPSYL